MKLIFVDTGPLQALNNDKDEYFDISVQILEKLRNGKDIIQLVTTDYILDEAYTGLLLKAGYYNAINLDRYVSRGEVKIIYINKERFSRAQTIFRRYNKDKSWSFTDCVSRVVMKENKITSAFTFDSHFDQMGYSVLK
jgi:uncharacterized protein